VVEKNPEDRDNHNYTLRHGITNHGFQYQLQEKRQLPTAYYTEDTGIGLAFNHHPSSPLNVGVIGLGIGVMAAYGEDGDEFKFYEINPIVAEIAESELFSFLEDSSSDVSVKLGDGRIVLENELKLIGPHNFDLFVLDAFNGDAIPTHLLTKEAFELYLQHLNPEGILAFHISNRHLDLRPVVWALADKFEMDGFEVENTPEDDRSYQSTWILLTTNRDFLRNPEIIQYSNPRSDDLPELRLWTDNYSNLFQILY
jgi:hypothetical protein